MEINNIIIMGIGESAKGLEDFFSKAGLNVAISDYSFSKADLIIEALPGDREAKKKAFRTCEEGASEKAIFATTSSGGISEMAAATKRPQKFIGLNFTANPFEEKYLVQIVKGLETSEETVQACRNLIEKAGATVVEVEESPGIILDRAMAAIINEAATMYATKVATIEDIDKAAKLCLNWPTGPFEFADTIGIDNVLNTLDILSQQKGPQYLPCRVLRQKVALGQLGKKAGKGFYTYS